MTYWIGIFSLSLNAEDDSSMTFPPEIGWIINPEAKRIPVNKRPFFIAFAAAPPSSRSFPHFFILDGNSRVGQFIFTKGRISMSTEWALVILQ
jgi:hypothetical protein